MKDTRMKNVISLRVAAAFTLACLCVCFGCIWEREDRQRVDLGVEPAEFGKEYAALFRDTIGAHSYYGGMAALPVRAYGLVVGLGKDGSRDCPKRVREQLVELLYKQRLPLESRVGVPETKPEQLIDDLDTAVVIVQGGIPRAATRGLRFDVSVQALPGTQTKSLRGGRLLPTDLNTFRVSTPGTVVTGKSMARASGPVFLNPFSDDESATKADPRQGIILGGGVVTADRQVRLVLTESSYSRALTIRDRINAHFPSPRPVADAVSPAFIELRIPPEYEEDAAHFLALLSSLYLSGDPQFEAVRARQLGQAMLKADAPHGRIALCLEGLGRTALPELGALYADENQAASFHAAVAGLRLGDHIAGDAVEMHAYDKGGRFRLQAIRALAEAEGMGGAAMALRRLLDDEDPRIQIAAYEGLLKRGDSMIASKRIAGDNFMLDRIPNHQGATVYVKRREARRIALFGPDLKCSPPLLYRSPDGSVTLTANTGDQQITVIRVVPATGTVSPPIPASYDLAALVELMGRRADVDLQGKVIGLGLDYGAIVRALYHLCEDRSVDARFILEQPNALELFGPPPSVGRPESES